MTETLIEDIVSVSVRNNTQTDITGILLFAEDHFLQLLEGPKEHVETTLQNIVNDRRHTDVRILFKGGAGERSFPDWHMKSAEPTAQQIAGVREMGSAQEIFDPLPKPYSPEIDFFIRAFFTDLMDVAA
jgi:hypothetical protein